MSLSLTRTARCQSDRAMFNAGVKELGVKEISDKGWWYAKGVVVTVVHINGYNGSLFRFHPTFFLASCLSEDFSWVLYVGFFGTFPALGRFHSSNFQTFVQLERT